MNFHLSDDKLLLKLVDGHKFVEKVGDAVKIPIGAQIITMNEGTHIHIDKQPYIAMSISDVVGYQIKEKTEQLKFYFLRSCIPDEIKDVKFIEDRIRARREAAEIASKEAKNSLWLEFGVGQGKSARLWLEYLPTDCELLLFDSFEGLPEPWDNGDFIEPVGYQKCGIPQFDDSRARIIKGLFCDTLPVCKFNNQIGFIHIDCDIYSSAICALDFITPYIRNGTIIIFDELYGYANYKNHEWKALNEWRDRNQWIQIQWLWRSAWSACCQII